MRRGRTPSCHTPACPSRVRARAGFIAILVGIAFVLTATPPLAADPTKVAHLSLSSDPPGFDPAGPTDAYSAAVLEDIFDRLLTYDYLARPVKLVPQAIEAMVKPASEVIRNAFLP